VSDTYSETVVRSQPLAWAPALGRRWSRWPKWIVLLLVCLWLADAGLSLLIQHSSLKNKLTAHLEAAVGRPVGVGRYRITVWKGLTLEAQSVTVGEDPRFGREYFLRADLVSVRPRWQSLLRGRFELGALSLTRPSLTVVRGSSGDWNLAEWLPKPSPSPVQNGAFGGPRPVPSALHFRRIEVDGGRINFKRADEKLPFAFVGVVGTVDTESPGLWRIDLRAIPWRAAVLIQQAGTIHVAGHVGGTSSRLLPAALDLSWADASVSDVLRLARSYDYGVRGSLGLSIAARTEGDAWTLEGRAQVRQLHRWDLALRSDNPSVNLIAKMKLYPEASGLQVTEAAIEGPRSNARAYGSVVWSRPAKLAAADSRPARLQIRSTRIDLRDVLAWVRAFHSDVAGDISLQGVAAVDLSFSGWPPHLAEAVVTSPGVDLNGARLRVPVSLGRVGFQFDRNRMSLLPTTVAFGPRSRPADGAFRIDMSSGAGSDSPASLRIAGGITQVRDLIATASKLGWNLSHGWELGGPFRCDLRWHGTQIPWQTQPVGSIELGGADGDLDAASLRAPFLNQPVARIHALAEWKPGARHITLSSAEAFGGRWRGTVDRRDSDREWQFALSADRLAAADLDRWLNPRWRESLLDRMLPFLNSRAVANAVPENLRASGYLSLDQFVLSPLVVRRLQGELKIEGRRIELANARGQFYGGTIGGSIDAALEATPRYRVIAGFSAVDLSALSAGSPELDGLFAGTASGEASFSARGASRADLLASLECRGTARVNGAELRSINLAESLNERMPRTGSSTFREGSAAFSCSDSKLQVEDLMLVGVGLGMDGSGSVDFSGHLNFHLAELPGGPSVPRPAGASGVPADEFELTGSLAAPQLVWPAALARRPR
jgi:hypothetical protein